MRYELSIGKRYLLSPRRDRSISAITWISICGIALGGMALIVSTSVMNGFRDNLRRSIIGSLPHVRVFGWDDHISVSEKLENQLLAHKEITAIAPYIFREALITGTSSPRGTLIRGIDPKREPQVTEMASFLRKRLYAPAEETQEAQQALANEVLARLEHPRPKEAQERDGIVLGAGLAYKLEVSVGDQVKLVSSEKRMTPIGEVPRVKLVEVVGIFESGISGYDEALAFIDYRLAQKVYNMGEQVTGVGIHIKDPENAPQVAKDLESTLGPYLIGNWADENKGIFQVMKLEKAVLFLALTLIVLVAAFNIISSLTMMVMEKSKDIAILKALGATDRSIRLIFMSQGIIIGIFGTLVGVLSGLGVCWVLKSFDIIDIPPGVYPGGNRVPVLIDWFYVSMTALCSFAICFFVTLYPSTRAARLHPVDALREE